jgi:PleD family two-component response regulator
MSQFFNILIMDNDKLNISKTKTFLNNNSNIRVFQALDIKDSLMVVIKNKIDLVIYDSQISDSNCLEIAGILQKNSPRKNIPFIFVGERFDDKFLSQEDGIDFISKPINSVSLQSKIAKYITL